MPDVSPRVEEPDLSANQIFAPVRAESFDNSTGSACEGLIKRTLSQGDNEAAGFDRPCDPASDTPLPELHHLNLHAEAVPVMPLSSLGFSSGLDPSPMVSLPPEPTARDATQDIQAPEALAERLLANLPVTPENVLTLMSLVPKEVPRSNVQTQGQRFSSGAWVHGGVSGLYRHATKLPATTKVLCALVKQVLSDHPFNAVTFLDECNSTCHRDVNNLDLPSLVIPLKGELCGIVLRAASITVKHPMVACAVTCWTLRQAQNSCRIHTVGMLLNSNFHQPPKGSSRQLHILAREQRTAAIV